MSAALRRLLALVMMVLALSLPRVAEAHFIWIEAEPVGKSDAPVEISQRVTFSFLVEASR